MKKMAIGASLTMLSCIACAETITTPLYLPPLSSSQPRQEESISKTGIDVFFGAAAVLFGSEIDAGFSDKYAKKLSSKNTLENGTDVNSMVHAGISILDKESNEFFMVKIEYTPVSLGLEQHNKHQRNDSLGFDIYKTEVKTSVIYVDFALGEQADKNTKFYYGLGLGYGRREDTLVKCDIWFPPTGPEVNEKYNFITGKLFAGIDYKVVSGLHIFAEPMIYSISKNFKEPNFSLNIGGRIVF